MPPFADIGKQKFRIFAMSFRENDFSETSGERAALKVTKQY